jgi:hypothetical protein
MSALAAVEPKGHLSGKRLFGSVLVFHLVERIGDLKQVRLLEGIRLPQRLSVLMFSQRRPSPSQVFTLESLPGSDKLERSPTD